MRMDKLLTISVNFLYMIWNSYDMDKLTTWVQNELSPLGGLSSSRDNNAHSFVQFFDCYIEVNLYEMSNPMYKFLYPYMFHVNTNFTKLLFIQSCITKNLKVVNKQAILLLPSR